MTEPSPAKPNWRVVWISSAVISTVFAASLVHAIAVQEPGGPAAGSAPGYVAVGIMFWAMLTVTGVVLIFRMTYDPAGLARRQALRHEKSKNSRVARATARVLRFVSRDRPRAS